jgi:hypothetical protein
VLVLRDGEHINDMGLFLSLVSFLCCCIHDTCKLQGVAALSSIVSTALAIVAEQHPFVSLQQTIRNCLITSHEIYVQVKL